jgi:hypothetical protein
MIFYLPKVLCGSDISEFYFYQSIFAQLTLFDFGLGLAAHIYLTNKPEFKLFIVSLYRLIQVVFLVLAVLTFILLIYIVELQNYLFLLLVIINNALAVIFRIDNINGDPGKYYRYNAIASIISMLIMIFLFTLGKSSFSLYLFSLITPQVILFLIYNFSFHHIDFLKIRTWRMFVWRDIISSSFGLMIISLSSLILNLYDSFILKNTADFLTYSHIIRLVNIFLLPVNIILILKQNQYLNIRSVENKSDSSNYWGKIAIYILLYCVVILSCILNNYSLSILSDYGIFGVKMKAWSMQFTLYFVFMSMLVFFSFMDSSSFRVLTKAKYYLGAVFLSVLTKSILISYSVIDFNRVLIINVISFAIFYFLPSFLTRKFTYETS